MSIYDKALNKDVFILEQNLTVFCFIFFEHKYLKKLSVQCSSIIFLIDPLKLKFSYGIPSHFFPYNL